MSADKDHEIARRKRFARELMTHSPNFEPFIPGQARTPVENLSILGGLEVFAAQSMAALLGAANAAAAQAAGTAAGAAADSVAGAVSVSVPAAASAPAGSAPTAAGGSDTAGFVSAQGTPPPRPAPRFESQHHDYRPALKDPSIIQALLEYHQKKNGRRPLSAGAPAGKSEAARQAAAQAPAESTAGFSHGRAPQIEADPKASRHFSATPTGTRTILRPKSSS